MMNQMYRYYYNYFLSFFLPKKRFVCLHINASLVPAQKKNISQQEKWLTQLTQGKLAYQKTIDISKAAQRLSSKKKDLPLVSCLMITKDRFALAKKSVVSFIKQTYPNLELIILDDSGNPELRDWVNNLKNPTIKFYYLPNESKTLGTLRNLSRQYATGTYIAQWDDDDLSHPNRVLYQMATIIQFGLDGCSLHREQIWFPSQQQMGFSERRIWEGSMIGHTDKLPLYHEIRKGEESDAVNTLALNGKIALLDFPQLYTYCYHQKNTFDALHFEQNIWAKASEIFDKKRYSDTVTALKQLIDIAS